MDIPINVLHAGLRIYKYVGEVAYSKPLLARKSFEKLARYLPSKHSGCTYESCLIEGVEMEWIFPENATKEKVFLFFHGGGFATGSIHTHRAMASQIAINAGVSALSVNYSLAPEMQFPTQLHECVVAYFYLLGKGYSPDQISIGGESAGACLVVSTLLFLKEKKVDLPACAVLMSPWLDLDVTGKSVETNKHKDPMVPHLGLHLWSDNYAGKKNRTHPIASPFYGDLKGLCPIYIQVGSNEVLVDDSKRFAKKAKSVGVEVRLEIWENVFHAWQGFWMILADGRKANAKIGEYLKEKLKIHSANK